MIFNTDGCTDDIDFKLLIITFTHLHVFELFFVMSTTNDKIKVNKTN